MRLTCREVDTPVGISRVHESGSGARLLVLGHGAGGGIEAPDLVAAAEGALAAGWRVALVEQPWRVRGRKIAEAPVRLDQAWVAVLATLRGTPLVVGGRSAGARVACRTSALVGADAVLCLGFPLHPPGRPERSRLPELERVAVPLLVVQGTRDAFGVPHGAHLIEGADHGFRVRQGVPPAAPQVQAAVASWLSEIRPKHA